MPAPVFSLTLQGEGDNLHATKTALETGINGAFAQQQADIDEVRDLAFDQTKIYPTTAAGIAATVVGQTFNLTSTDPNVALYIYRHDLGGVATLIATTPSVPALADKTTDTAVAAMTVLLFGEPNIWADDDWSRIVGNAQSNVDPDGYYFVSANANVSRAQEPDGTWSLSITSADASEARVLYRQYIAALGFLAGDTVTVELDVVTRTGAAGTSATRVMLIRYNAAGAEIARSSQTIAPGFVGRIPAITATLEAGTDRIAVWISAANTTVSLTVKNILLSRSSIGSFRAAAAPYIIRVAGPHAA